LSMRLLWAWFVAWSAADVATTLYFHHAGIGEELNIFTNALAAHVGFDAAVVIITALSPLLVWPLCRSRYLRAAAFAVLATRFVAPLNNMVLIFSGLSIVDYISLALGIGAYQALLLFILASTAPVVIYSYRRVPPPPPRFSNFFRRQKNIKMSGN